MDINKLYCGDNLKIMKDMESESVDLIYADPPFFSQVNYGDFDDHFESMGHYIDFICERLIEMHTLLKPTGSIYLHCDWHASHRIRCAMDDVFGYKNFRNEIIWHYNRWTNTSSNFQRMYDSILFYAKETNPTFNIQYEFTSNIIKSYKKGYNVNKTDNGIMQLIVYDAKKAAGEIKKSKYGKIVYHESKKGVAMHDVWNDISFIPPMSNERLGYSTQKPEALLERIIKASSNMNDVVFDPFCGCGTTPAVAKKLGRKWIGIDSNPKAIKLTEDRLSKIPTYKRLNEWI